MDCCFFLFCCPLYSSMKYPISTFCLLLLCFSPRAQAPLSALTPVTIHLQTSQPPLTLASPFRYFEVIDARPDTARIGIHAFVPTIGHPHNRQLVFPQRAASEIAHYLNSRFTRPNAPYTALIVLRSLWLSDANYLREDRVKNPEILYDRTHIRLKAEIYAVSDSSYIPVLRYDTLQAYKRSNVYNNLTTYYSLWEQDLAAVVDDMADSASGLAVAKADRGRRIHLEDILNYNHSRFDNAITGNTALVNGVYANFEEFRNNAPSIKEFEVRTEKKNLILYLHDAGGTTSYSHDAWGCSDGKSIYIMRDGMLYPIFKEGKSFYFYAMAYKEELTHNNNGIHAPWQRVDDAPAANAPEPSRKPYLLNTDTRSRPLEKRIFTVDMDSGKVY
jgi:hypothetical protein